MAEMIKVTDSAGWIHYIAWSQIVDVYFPASADYGYVVTAARGIEKNTADQAYKIMIPSATPEKLRALLDARADPVGDVEGIAEELSRKQTAAPPVFASGTATRRTW